MKSISGVASFKLNVKRSVFIANISRVNSQEEAREFVRRISRDHADATHNCWAYRVYGGGGILEHFSDAGEPRGSAGIPILNTLKKHDLVNVSAVVSRYFGGVKLGIRGLIDAYSSVVEMALSKARFVKLRPVKIFKVEAEYSKMGKIISRINSMGGKIIKMENTESGVILIYSFPGDGAIGEKIDEGFTEFSL